MGTRWGAALVVVGLSGCGPEVALAPGVTVQEAVVGQNTGVLLAQDGEVVTERLAPVVAGRDARVRVVVSSDEVRDVSVVLTLDGVPVTAQEVIGLGETVVQLEVPGDLLAEGTQVSLAVTDPEGRRRAGVLAGAQIPAEGATMALGVREMPVLEVVVVPLDAGEGGPAIGADVLARLAAVIEALFPVAGVSVSLRSEAMPFDVTVSGASSLAAPLEDLVALRDADGVTDDTVVYLGLYTASAFGAGLATDSQLQPGFRSAIAPLQLSDVDTSALTVAHELGHLHGALHAPCEVTTSDPAYPFDDGRIGVRAWDGLEETWRGPKTGDLMGYCLDKWIGPYTSGQVAEGLLWAW